MSKEEHQLMHFGVKHLKYEILNIKYWIYGMDNEGSL